ncbi:YqaJ viral recombinase family protein [Streptomyces sp. MMS24-I2-30]|uniref:YqaJ viral recombinase family nuclease n=1 Tax=Streptomyces sp. MMS24-I2-30 TaxID=3351564 RepID=UPI003896AC3B
MSAATTPTGILLGSFTPGTPEWNEARKGLCITATEIAAVVGLSPWQSAFSLWHKKANLPTAPFETSPQMTWGSRFEDDVAEEFAERHPEHPLLTTGTWRHRDRAWQRATPDRLHGNRLVEIKTAASADGWGPDGSDEFPVHYRCQVTWQQDTLGLYEPAHLAVLILPYDYREYVIEYDPDDARILRDAAERFLRTVREGERPPIDGDTATYQTIRVQADGLEDRDVEIPFGTAIRWDDAYTALAKASADLTQVRGEVLDLIGNGKRAVCEGRRIAYRTVRDGHTHSLNPYTSKDAA